MTNGIGILNEGPLHLALKGYYAGDGSAMEVPVGNYVADVRGADEILYEIQTGGFSGLGRKLEALLESHRVVLVHPIAQVRFIVKQTLDDDVPPTRRRSPKRGSVANILDSLVSIPTLLNHENFELEVVMTEEEEVRVPNPHGSWRRRGWKTASRRLLEIREQHRFTSAQDLLGLVPGELPEVFTTADLAVAMDKPRALAQKLAYCLRQAGVITMCGKVGNALEYQRS